ncbi:hypothetical protein UG55_10225 [Frankia sp. EI5c]|uniref:choice-of-anchor P family protein n=1 Tax=Frankia sp. EI5c TaxID=683316 RepID=UPI0007C2B102|nr:choice-of-anchor P family protein [Frankia sp. EI5c]OAA25345.1 hypothetical protein UG55_10225 [Frankia sp. EI5c]
MLDIGGLNILGGLITADAVRSQANVTKSPGVAPVLSSAGTTFTNLVVAGIPIAANVPPNTGIALPGVGYVVLNRQFQTSNSIEVRALDVVITVAGVLPVNAVIRVGVAGAQATDDGITFDSPPQALLNAPADDKPLEEYLYDTCAKAENSAECLGADLELL